MKISIIAFLSLVLACVSVFADTAFADTATGAGGIISAIAGSTIIQALTSFIVAAYALYKTIAGIVSGINKAKGS